MTTTDFDKIIWRDALTFVDFFATWCGPCQMMQPAIDKFQREMNGRVDVYKVDIDDRGMLDAVHRYNIMSVPTLMFFRRGEVLWRESGLASYDHLVNVLRELEKKSEEYQQLMDESEALQDDLMQEIAAKEKDLKQAKYDEYLAKLAMQGENPPSNASWTTPVSGYTITSPFGMRTHPILGTQRMHNGIDMACNQGTPIYATRAGTVTVASYQAGGAGYYVSINHLDGFASIYMHMTNYVVSAGQSVSQGQLIGYVGSTGLSTGPHLHFGISYAGTYVNPLAYIL